MPKNKKESKDQKDSLKKKIKNLETEMKIKKKKTIQQMFRKMKIFLLS